MAEALGGISVVHGRTGKPLAWVGEICQVAGKHSRHDVQAAIALWDEYVRSEEWNFRKRDPKALAACFGAWLAARERPKDGRATEHPDRRKDELMSPEQNEAIRRQIADLRARGLIDLLPRKPKQ